MALIRLDFSVLLYITYNIRNGKENFHYIEVIFKRTRPINERRHKIRSKRSSAVELVKKVNKKM